MADLYGTNSKTPSPESEEMSSFLHNLLQSSSMASSPSFVSFKPKHLPSSSSPPPPQPPPPPPPLPETSTSAVLWRSSSATFISDADRVRGGASTDGSSVMIDSVSDFNFSDPGGFFPAGAKGSTSNTFSSAGVVVDSDAITSLMKNKKFPAENHFTDLSFSCERRLEASEVPGNQVPLPRSAKRTRAAEVHNLSEKRRRSRINEKLKALQNLIPNSNKTDKASMLDEAIEYLKQLQLQVQMLSMRNGLSLHPIYIPGSLQSLQLPETGVGFDEGNGLMNTNRTADTFCGNQEIPTLPAFDISNQCTPSNQPIVRPPTINSINPGTTFGLESLIQNQYGPITHLTASKEICREDTQSRLQIDTGKNSLSGMSS